MITEAAGLHLGDAELGAEGRDQQSERVGTNNVPILLGDRLRG
jgi:hypothetical protein